MENNRDHKKSVPEESDTAERFRRHIEARDRAIGRQRIGDLHRLFSDRYGGSRESYVFPDDDAGTEDLIILLQHYRANNPLAMRRIIKLRAPWMSEAEAAHTLEQVEAYPRRWRSETLGGLLNLTGDEWKRLRLRTIAPVDMTKDERRAFSTKLNTERRRLRRLAKGMKTRTEWLEENKTNRTKPWEELGISKATYYRRRSRNVPETPPNDRETGLAAIKISIEQSDQSHRNQPRGQRSGGRAKKSRAETSASTKTAQPSKLPRYAATAAHDGMAKPGNVDRKQRKSA
jgi:hypothetical protein